MVDIDLFMREQIKSAKTLYDNNVLQVSVSIGVTEYKPELALKDFFKQADEALYRAKDAGRDRIEAYS